VAFLRKAQERYPADFSVNSNLAIALECLKPPRREEAISYFRAVVALRPGSPGARLNLGRALRLKGDADGAIAAYQKAIALDPKYVEAHVHIGIILCDVVHDHDEAIARFHKALALDPKHIASLNSLANAQTHKGDLDGARATYRKVLGLDSKNAEAHAGLSVLACAQGDLQGTSNWASKALALDAKCDMAQNCFGISLLMKGDPDRAGDYFRKAIDLAPTWPGPYENLGMTLAAKGDLEGAITWVQKALAIDPKWVTAHYALGNVLMQKGDLEGAAASFRQAIALKPDYPEAHCNLGHVLQRRGKFAEALAELKRGHELGSRKKGWNYPSADWVQSCEQSLKVEESLRAVLEGRAQPKDVNEQLRFAQLCLGKQFYARSAQLYSEALASAPTLAKDRGAAVHRYNAACAAARAGCAQGADASKLDAKERRRWRQQALGWLRVNLTALGEMLHEGTPAVRGMVRLRLQYWQKDANLSGLRDPAELAKLSPEEHAACLRLWAEVATLLAKALDPN
jgi:tetratricopeptide (TPR) repeat protein